MKKFILHVLILLTAGAVISVGTQAWSQPYFAQSPPLAKFVQPLRGLGPGGIPVAAPDPVRKYWWQFGVTHYTIDINQYTDTLHPGLGPTTLWGYNPTIPKGGGVQPQKHLGGIIVAERGKPVQITFQNNLPNQHFLPVDTSPFFADALNAAGRTAVHLHGGLVPWISDGGPFDWWDKNGNKGPSFFNNQVLHPGALPNQAEYYYPNNQGARFVWYHDHYHDLTRINAYAGIASAYVITDWYETLLTNFPFNIPGPLDARTLYLVFQDKIFVDAANIASQDPNWAGLPVPQTTGSLWYAHTYLGPEFGAAQRWDRDTTKPLPPDPSVIPEFFGDTILVNGSVYPFVEVQQRVYRFRMLNACNARFLTPRIVKASSTDATEPDSYTNPATAVEFTQIGNEGGFLPYPAKPKTTSLVLDVNGNPTGATVVQPYLTLAPAERADLIADFRNVPPGYYILYSDAPAPFPAGDPLNDYYPGSGNPTVTAPGQGPNTRTLLQIHVTGPSTTVDRLVRIPPFFTPTDPFMVFQKQGVPNPVPAPGAATFDVWVLPFKKVTANVRHLTLNEAFDDNGRLVQYLGTNVEPVPGQGFGRNYLDAPTEVVNAGAYEIWEIANLTGDSHPIHIHLVNAQVLARQFFDVANYAGTPARQGNVIAPDFYELGWKETIRMNPGQVTWILMKFDLPFVPFNVPTSERFGMPPAGVKYNEYVWHCHILEHEEHDMMRPLVVVK